MNDPAWPVSQPYCSNPRAGGSNPTRVTISCPRDRENFLAALIPSQTNDCWGGGFLFWLVHCGRITTGRLVRYGTIYHLAKPGDRLVHCGRMCTLMGWYAMEDYPSAGWYAVELFTTLLNPSRVNGWYSVEQYDRISWYAMEDYPSASLLPVWYAVELFTTLLKAGWYTVEDYHPSLRWYTEEEYHRDSVGTLRKIITPSLRWYTEEEYHRDSVGTLRKNIIATPLVH